MEPTNTRAAGYWTPYSEWAKRRRAKLPPRRLAVGRLAPCAPLSIGRRTGSGHRPPTATTRR
eukprot:270048-Amphidinium_carterae.1